MANGGGPAEDVDSVATGNLAERAHAVVSEMIRRRRLRGGEIIVEARLAEELAISRTPLREALQRLEGEGLVVKGPGRSCVVRHVDLAEYLQSLKAREIVEPEAAAMAVGRIAPDRLARVRRNIEALRRGPDYHTDAHWRSDDDVHGLSIEGCGNPVLGRIIGDLRVTTRLFEIARLADRLEPDSVEHLAIVDALASGDAKLARKAAQAHVKSLFRHALETVG